MICVLIRLPEKIVYIPNDQVNSLSRVDVISAVSLTAEMHHTPTGLMVIDGRKSSVILPAQHSAKDQARPSELSPEANVESHITVVGVHIQAQILAWLVPNKEGVMSVELRTFTLIQLIRYWMQHSLLHCVDEWFHSYLCEDQSIIIPVNIIVIRENIAMQKNLKQLIMTTELTSSWVVVMAGLKLCTGRTPPGASHRTVAEYTPGVSSRSMLLRSPHSIAAARSVHSQSGFQLPWNSSGCLHKPPATTALTTCANPASCSGSKRTSCRCTHHVHTAR